MPTGQTDEILKAFSRFVRDVVREVMREFEAEREAKAAEPILLSPRDAAKYLGLGKTSFYSLRSSGEIPVLYVAGRMPRFRRADLDRYIEKIAKQGRKRR